MSSIKHPVTRIVSDTIGACMLLPISAVTSVTAVRLKK